MRNSPRSGHPVAFVPARSKLEAVTRLSTLAGKPPETLGPGSKERKSVLIGLSDGLGLGISAKLTKHEIAQEIATTLGVAWTSESVSTGQTITLEGLNRLLKGMHHRVERAALPSQEPLLEVARLLPENFVPASNKLEAVTRISQLTGSPPEELGPGSKERKSVLMNLATGLGLAITTRRRKPDIAAEIARALDTPWDDSCFSAGDTITLTGLNRILEAAEGFVRQQELRGTTRLFRSAAEEAMALLNALATAIPPVMDGVECIEEMRLAESTHWAQDEWAGFYFEFVGLPTLVNTFGGGPIKYANTRFDYNLGHTWDLKLHTSQRPVAPLNAVDAVDAVLASGRGLGFIVLSGLAERSMTFRGWRREHRAMHGKQPRKRNRPAAFQREAKSVVHPERLDAYYFSDLETLDAALHRKVLRVMRQGRQVSGHPRRPKYELSMNAAALPDFHVAHRWLTD